MSKIAVFRGNWFTIVEENHPPWLEKWGNAEIFLQLKEQNSRLFPGIPGISGYDLNSRLFPGIPGIPES